jgi:hypothetical protein
MGYWVALLGGSKFAESRAYTDPPMHVTCAEAAIRLCPHIARPTTQRAKDDRMRTASTNYTSAITPSGMELDRPASWALYVTRQYDIEQRGTPGLTANAALSTRSTPTPAKRLREFRYGSDGGLSEV